MALRNTKRMSNKYHTACTFRNSAAARKMAANYRKQFGIGLDGKPRRYGKKAKRPRDQSDRPAGRVRVVILPNAGGER